MSTRSVHEQFMEGLGEAANAPLGLAVSGGGDSMALLHLAVSAGLKVQAVTVDHQLRAESANEAAFVGRVCQGLGVAHTVLQWRGWDGRGNLQDHARRARRELIGAWARGADIATVGLGHTRDDVAETFLMRLARGAGVDGLAAMAAAWRQSETMWRRPLLGVARDALRDYLLGIGATWVEDPSNAHMRFDRVKARKILVSLAPLGLSSARLAEVAGHLQEARLALEAASARAANSILQADLGAEVIDAAAFAAEAGEVQRRVLLGVIQRIAPAEFGPRGPALARLQAAVLAGHAAVLQGVRFLPQKTGLRAFREAKAVAGVVAAQGELWDGRWRMHGPWQPEMQVRALGTSGLAECVGWRDARRPRAELMGSPAVWLGARLIAAPLAGFGPEWHIEMVQDRSVEMNLLYRIEQAQLMSIL